MILLKKYIFETLINKNSIHRKAMSTLTEIHEESKTNNSIYPSIGQSFGIMGIAFLMMLAFSPILYYAKFFMDEELSFLFYYVASMGTTFLIVNSMKKNNPDNQPFDFKPGNSKIILAVTITIIAVQFGIITPLISLIPMPDFMIEIFMQMAGRNGTISFLTIVIAAPVFEELIFRGIMLNGLLKRYNPTKAILISSLLFGLIHLNPWQFISAFIIGVFAGWIYYKTQKLSFAIIIHMINNGLAFFTMTMSDTTVHPDAPLIESYGGLSTFLLITLGSILIVILGISYLRKEFDTIEKTNISTE
jgi:membrane protease YdiL (CAAX protease family)